jgi:2-methylcitrate dehydratase PrpD
MTDVKSKSRALAEFTANLSSEAIPDSVKHRAKLQILDAIGVGVAARSYPFADKAISGVKALGGSGVCSVIGEQNGMSARDAALANGMLLHGLDFDDTHLGAIIHASVATLPAALAVGEAVGASGRDMLVAYVAGMETSIRIGLAAKGAFHHAGYHATAVASHFSSAIIAGKLMGLNADELTMAQGVTGSSAAGLQVFLEEGAWTKRFHPGWGAVAGITAATLAQQGFVGPSRVYEGKFGLFETHFQSHLKDTDADELDADLGKRWELAVTAIKPYPVCHFIHGCADAAIEISREIDVGQISSVEAYLPGPTMPIVAEPAASKLTPKTDYEAKFSAQFVIATCLAKGYFGLAELRDEAFSDPELLDLTAKVTCASDPDTRFPTYFSGGLTVHLDNGKSISRHVPINSGAGERMLDEAGVSAKFRASAKMSIAEDHAEKIREAVLNLDQLPVSDLGNALRSA